VKSSEADHIKRLGAWWNTALAATTMSVRQNAKLVGLDKIREPIAMQAALKATGCKSVMGFNLPKNAGEPFRDIEDLVNSAFAAAVEAAERVLGSYATA